MPASVHSRVVNTCKGTINLPSPPVLVHILPDLPKSYVQEGRAPVEFHASRKCAQIGDSSLLQIVQMGSGAHPTPYSMGIEVLSPEAMRPGRDVDNSPPSSARDNKEWSYTSTPLI